MRKEVAVLLGVLAVAYAVPTTLQPKDGHHKHAKHVPAETAAAAADLITNLPGAPKDLTFKQYAGK